MMRNTVGYLVSSIFLEQWGKSKGFKNKNYRIRFAFVEYGVHLRTSRVDDE